jgi:hypothetical protein
MLLTYDLVLAPASANAFGFVVGHDDDGCALLIVGCALLIDWLV